MGPDPGRHCQQWRGLTQSPGGQHSIAPQTGRTSKRPRPWRRALAPLQPHKAVFVVQPVGVAPPTGTQVSLLPIDVFLPQVPGGQQPNVPFALQQRVGGQAKVLGQQFAEPGDPMPWPTHTCPQHFLGSAQPLVVPPAGVAGGQAVGSPTPPPTCPNIVPNTLPAKTPPISFSAFRRGVGPARMRATSSIK